jgi:O-glycosyl hydrolase
MGNLFIIYFLIMRSSTNKCIDKKRAISAVRYACAACFILICLLLKVDQLSAQTEVMAWGNITGIRVDGQLMNFESSLMVIGKNGSVLNATGRERQRPRYHRDGQTQTVTTELGGIRFLEAVTDDSPGKASVSLTSTALKDTVIDGAYFCIDLPDRFFATGIAQFQNGKTKGKSIKLAGLPARGEKQQFKSADEVILSSEERQIEIKLNTISPVSICRNDESPVYSLYIRLTGPEIKKGSDVKIDISLVVNGKIDATPAEIMVDSKNPGNRFAGFGGNFRLQNPSSDPKVIQYCLDNMRVAWGRVEMPWQLWQPDENTNPIEAALNGKLDKHVKESMEMAQKLAKRGIPMIISDWSAPDWAIIGTQDDAYRNRNRGIFGYPLNPEKTGKIYKSIGDYLAYLKQAYGVEPALFSFNESDLGINIRHTGREHADFIKGMGAYLASRGIVTKMLLGDNSDATTFDFILPAMNDPETHKYISAVSFHSWRGCDNETLKKWAGAARKMNLPLIVAEGSTDAAAWNYPEIFNEQAFAMYEINLYVRICSVSQPLSILQWQLTSDYSVMTGDGIFGTAGPLRPTSRFWNLKQLASTPAEAFSLQTTCSSDALNCAAFGNIARGEYAVHIVNNGAGRKASVKGLPADASVFEVFVTNETKGMEKTGEVTAVNGTLQVNLLPASFTTLISKK